MKEIAYKSKSSEIMLFLGAVSFALLSILSVTIKPNGWTVYTSLSVAMIIIFIVSFCYELKKPNCLIKLSDDFLLIYAKKKWNKIHTNEVIDVKYRKTQSGRIVVNSGKLNIATNNSTYTLYNVKDVEDVAFTLREIKK